MHFHKEYFLFTRVLYVTIMLVASTAGGQVISQRFDVEVTDQGRVIVDGVEYESWSAYAQSDFFRKNNLRCGTAHVNQPWEPRILGSAADCTYTYTNAAADYDPSVVKFYIPVVVHVIQDTSGTGYISEAMIQSQIDVLNEDFLALPGTYGAPGTDVQIELYLADEDPAGLPTNGITYTTNDSWFNDSGVYYSVLSWDTNRYLNIYTNLSSGYLGYAYLPQAGSVGQDYDRVVIYYAAFGRNSPIGPPYDQGRTATHEVGHYLGLFHVFDGCGTPCETSGDKICDTNPQLSENYNCDNGSTCSIIDNNTNYMDYVDDLCSDQFTPDQARRLRCTLEFWRVDLFQLDPGCALDPALDCNSNCVIDAEELSGGTEFDCNENGILDSCDLVDPISPSLDCNGNAIPDECEDCNGNGIADSCEFQSAYSVNSPTLSPVGFGAPATHTFIAPPVAVGDVTITFHAVADIALSFETFQVYFNLSLLGNIYEEAGYTACSDPPAVDTLVMTATTFNALIAGGNLLVEVTAGSFVSAAACGGVSSIQFDLDYPIASTVNDTNGNGVPDECDLARGDNNLDGVVNVEDLVNLLAAWGTCADPGNCPVDTNGDGEIDVLDLIALLAGWD